MASLGIIVRGALFLVILILIPACGPKRAANPEPLFTYTVPEFFRYSIQKKLLENNRFSEERDIFDPFLKFEAQALCPNTLLVSIADAWNKEVTPQARAFLTVREVVKETESDDSLHRTYRLQADLPALHRYLQGKGLQEKPRIGCLWLGEPDAALRQSIEGSLLDLQGHFTIHLLGASGKNLAWDGRSLGQAARNLAPKGGLDGVLFLSLANQSALPAGENSWMLRMALYETARGLKGWEEELLFADWGPPPRLEQMPLTILSEKDRERPSFDYSLSNDLLAWYGQTIKGGIPYTVEVGEQAGTDLEDRFDSLVFALQQEQAFGSVVSLKGADGPWRLVVKAFLPLEEVREKVLRRLRNGGSWLGTAQVRKAEGHYLSVVVP